MINFYVAVFVIEGNGFFYEMSHTLYSYHFCKNKNWLNVDVDVNGVFRLNYFHTTTCNVDNLLQSNMNCI